MWRLFALDFIIMAMVAVSISLTIFNVNNTIVQTDKKADDISNSTHIIQKELRTQVELVQKTLDNNRVLLNVIGNQSLHIDNSTDHIEKLITKNYNDILFNRQIQLDILNNLTKH